MTEGIIHSTHGSIDHKTSLTLSVVRMPYPRPYVCCSIPDMQPLNIVSRNSCGRPIVEPPRNMGQNVHQQTHRLPSFTVSAVNEDGRTCRVDAGCGVDRAWSILDDLLFLLPTIDSDEPLAAVDVIIKKNRGWRDMSMRQEGNCKRASTNLQSTNTLHSEGPSGCIPIQQPYLCITNNRMHMYTDRETCNAGSPSQKADCTHVPPPPQQQDQVHRSVGSRNGPSQKCEASNTSQEPYITRGAQLADRTHGSGHPFNPDTPYHTVYDWPEDVLRCTTLQLNQYLRLHDHRHEEVVDLKLARRRRLNRQYACAARDRRRLRQPKVEKF